MPYLVDVVEGGELVTRCYRDADRARVTASGALVVVDKYEVPLAGFARWASFRRVDDADLADLVEVD